MLYLGGDGKDKLMPEMKLHDSLVSVIVPVYNVAPYLREALDSVVQQIYSHLDIIIVDDGSTDGSGSICDEYRYDPRVTVVHQRHQGVSAARNTGLDHVAGEYIAFLDPDDAYDRSFIRTMLEVMIRENSDIVVCKYYKIKTVNKMKPDAKQVCLPLSKAGVYNRKGALQALVNGDMDVHVWNKLYKRELWRSCRFPEEFSVGEDCISFNVFDLCDKVYVIEQPLMFHRDRPGSLTKGFTEKTVYDIINVYHYEERFIESHIPELLSDSYLLNNKKGIYYALVNGFAHVKDRALSNELKKQIISSAERIGIENCGFKWRISYYLIRFCPGLFKILYAIYVPIRKRIYEITGR